MKLLKTIANLGYGTRKEVAAMFRDGRVTNAVGDELDEDSKVEYADIRLDEEPLDPAPGVLLMLHKPVGYVCSTKDAGRLIYELMPKRFPWRKPVLSSVGRLDRDTSGLLLMTDDGALLHRIISPRAKVSKTYEVSLAQALAGDEADLFASGTLMLESEETPLAPAVLRVHEPRRASLTITEGRYHQVRRMFAAVGNHVAALHRSHVGGLGLGELPAGHWRALDESDTAQIFGGTLSP